MPYQSSWIDTIVQAVSIFDQKLKLYRLVCIEVSVTDKHTFLFNLTPIKLKVTQLGAVHTFVKMIFFTADRRTALHGRFETHSSQTVGFV